MGKSHFPPGPKGGLFGQLREMRSDLLGLYNRCHLEYGDAFTLRIASRRFVFFCRPDLIEEVMITKAGSFVKANALRMNRRLLGDGLLTSEGALWLRQRRMLQPAFRRDRIDAYAPMMISSAERMARSWCNGQIVDMLPEMTRLTLEIIAKALFDSDVSGDVKCISDAMSWAIGTFTKRFFRVLQMPEWLPTPLNVKIRAEIWKLDKVVFGLIEERRRGRTGRVDVLSILLGASDDADGHRMSTQQLRDEAMTIFMAGHETTALMLSWTWYLLARHPAVGDRLQSELERTLPGGREPNPGDLPKLQFTEMIILESLRLFPPAYAIAREVVEECEIGQYSLPAGTTIILSPWIMHRHAKYFTDPERFIPERWSGSFSKGLPKCAFFPFGAGGRTCIGNTFAMVEAVLVLATLARRFRCRADESVTVMPVPQLTLRPTPGVPVILESLRSC